VSDTCPVNKTRSVHVSDTCPHVSCPSRRICDTEGGLDVSCYLNEQMIDIKNQMSMLNLQSAQQKIDNRSMKKSDQCTTISIVNRR
jgi:hypothetical protein